jgi:tripartite-type tricarboxylate transporter receptor subunit TctC
LSEGLASRLGQSVVPINRPGANTNIGTLAAIRAKPDGHTLVMASIGLAANPALYRNLGFAPQTDLEPISLIANAPSLLAVHPSFPADTLAEFIAYAKAHPGELNYASYGVGSSAHLAAELFQSATGTRLVHIPFGGGGPAALAVISNSVHMVFSSLLPVLGQVKSGALKVIAVAAEQRLPLLPDVPTFKEGGIDYVTGTWFGVLAPAKTPEPIVAKLHAAAVAVFADPVARKKLTDQGAEVVVDTPDEFRGFLKDETERLSLVIRRANIRLD